LFFFCFCSLKKKGEVYGVKSFLFLIKKFLEKGEKMRLLFEELVNGNLPEGFKLEKREEYYFLYRTNPSTEQITAFKLNDANSEKVEERFRNIFMSFGYKFNERTKKKWER